MRAHVIEDGKIVNTIEIERLDLIPGLNLVDADLVGGVIGDDYDEKSGSVQAPAPAAVDLGALKAAKNADIDRWRAQANATVFPYADKLIAVDDLSWKDILSTAGHIALFDAFPSEWPGGWKATDKTYVPMPTVDDFKAMFMAMTARGTENFNHSQSLKAALAQATTPEEVAAIVWG